MKLKTKDSIENELYKLDLYKAPIQLLNRDNQFDFLSHSLTFIIEKHMLNTARRWINFNQRYSKRSVLYYAFGYDLIDTTSEMVVFSHSDFELG